MVYNLENICFVCWNWADTIVETILEADCYYPLYTNLP